ncbi:Aste57867_8430 [Aphanomyces stellatus]|uniref:Aste57867_8430 protein n=1 Tax=Aphanomyces stellatus TaxID=120398 RepID=A0A485KK97_9STRA|nr:hypothetical protein As57867_008398 [Aphanomyces stellatus]VFT85316.1 Aste57867_8430 [Aphanomyces stellatus]
MDASLAFTEGFTAASTSPWTLPVTFLMALSVFLSFFFNFSDPVQPAGRRLKRRMTSTGLTTLLTETDSNRSILFTLTVLDKIVTVDEFAAHLREIMTGDFWVRFRSTVVDKSFVLVDDFNVADHIHFHALAADETAHSVAESLYNAPLDATKPLWAAHLVHEAGQTHVMWRIHHCLGDGQSMSMVFLKVCDNGNDVLAAAAAVPEPKPPKMTPIQTLLLFLWSLAIYLYKVARMFTLNESTQYYKQPGHTSKHLSYSLALTVDETKAVGKQIKASINDVMLSCVAGGLNKLLPADEPRHAGMFLRAAIPINMRPSNDKFLTTSNMFSSLMVELPIGETDGVKRTRRVVRAMNEAKFSLEKVFTLALTKFMSHLPDALMVLMAHRFTTRVSVAITNVRGPGMELTMAGAKVVQSFGFIPPPPSVNVGIAITSIGNTLGLTVATDKSIDATKLMAAIETEFAVLKASLQQK